MTLPPSGVDLLKTRSGVVKIVDRRDRRVLVYDLHAATYAEETDVDPTASAECREVPHVPVYCEECYGIPVPSIESTALPERGLFVAGVACVFSPEPDPETKSDDTISREYIAKYTQPLAAARHTAQEAPGEFRFGHSETIGEVLFYWHVHSRGKVYLNCLATITEKAFAVDVFCASREGGLSLGTWDVGSNHLIKECSLVVVPARPGCRCKIVEGRAAAETLMADLRFGKPKAGVKLAAFEPDAVREDAPPPSVANKLMLSYIGMMKTYINVLKTCNSHKEVCALEEYIKKGETATTEDLGPALSSQKLLEASMAQPAAPTAPQQMAAPHPAPPPQPSTSGYHPWASAGFPPPMHAPQYASMFGPPGGGNYFGWGAPPPQDWTAQYVPTKPKTIAETISDTVAAALTSAMTRNEIGSQKRKAEAPAEPPPAAKQPRDETADLTAALREFLAANRLTEGPPPAPASVSPPASSLEKELTDLKDLVASMGAAIKTLTAPAEPPPAAAPAPAPPAAAPAAPVEQTAAPETAPVLTAGFSASKKQSPAPKTKYTTLSSFCK